MPKFARKKTPPNVTAPVVSRSDAPDAFTAEGGTGFTRDAKSELFLLALTNMVGEATFYEAARDRDRRFATLIKTVAVDDPSWIGRFVPYLRDTMHMRSASVVMAAEFARARTGEDAAAGGEPTTRSVIASAMSRADEPAELLAYWHQTHGRRIPQPVKRGLADAAQRLYTERNALKYDGQSRVYRMADVLELAHPEPVDERQSALFKYVLDRRHGREDARLDGERLPIIAARAELEAVPLDDRRALLDSPAIAGRFSRAGVTWEWLSGWIGGPMDAKAWEAVIPSMGYMALLRNLRNFDDASVSAATRDAVIAKLTDPSEVARSRQLPLRFYSAWKSVATLHWGPAIERALELSLQNVPALRGRTLVMVDVSGSMASAMSNRSSAQRWELAALFGSALASRAEHADVVAFESNSHEMKIKRGASMLRSIDGFKRHVGGGTNTWPAVRKHFKKHDRIVILTDEQAFYDATHAASLGADFAVPIYTFNLAGYRAGNLPAGGHQRYTFGGLSDQGFAAIEILERGRDLDWSAVFDMARRAQADMTDADEAADSETDA